MPLYIERNTQMASAKIWHPTEQPHDNVEAETAAWVMIVILFGSVGFAFYSLWWRVGGW
jgi:hypothetical protein